MKMSTLLDLPLCFFISRRFSQQQLAILSSKLQSFDFTNDNLVFFSSGSKRTFCAYLKSETLCLKLLTDTANKSPQILCYRTLLLLPYLGRRDVLDIIPTFTVYYYYYLYCNFWIWCIIYMVKCWSGMDNYTCMANNCTVLFEVKEKPLKHWATRKRPINNEYFQRKFLNDVSNFTAKNLISD